MKIAATVSMLLIVSVAFLWSRQPDGSQFLKRLELTDQEIEQVTKLQSDTEKEKREAAVELNLIKAQMEKLLLDVDVEMSQVEKLLRSSLEWKLKVELAEINRRVAMRKILGEKRWRKYLAVRRNRRQQQARPRRQTPQRQQQPQRRNNPAPAPR